MSNTFPATVVFKNTWNAINSKKYKLIVQEGSSRSSKTWSDFQCLFLYNGERPNKITNVLRDTAIDCRDIVETEWVKWLSDPQSRSLQFERGEITAEELTSFLLKEDLKQYFIENKTKHTWTYKHNKSVIRFTGIDDEDKVMGMTQNVLWINEPYKFSHEVYKQLAQRTSDFIILDWNPKKSSWIEDEKKKESTIVLHSTFLDNPFCPAESKKQLLSYQPVIYSNVVESGLITVEEARNYDCVNNPSQFSEKQIKELSRCQYNAFVKSASEYHWQVYGKGIKAEQPNRIFFWDECSLQDYNDIDAPIYTGCDWGSVDPWAIADAKYYDGCMYLRERNYQSENEIRERLTPTEQAQINGSEEGIVTWMFKKLGVPLNRTIICDTNRNTKIRALRVAGYDYAQPASKVPGSIIDGIDVLTNLRVYYTSDSENIRYEQENYSRKIDRFGVVLEEPEDTNNHQMDVARYIALYLQINGIIKKI